jgi:hypothetical protein
MGVFDMVFIYLTVCALLQVSVYFMFPLSALMIVGIWNC